MTDKLFMQNRVKILISARDPATAEAFKILLAAIHQDKRFSVVFVAQEPAYGILASTQYPSLPTIQKIPSFNSQNELLSCADDLVKKSKPEIVLTGISGPDFGIDEALLTVTPRTKFGPYALQSYWGDVNRSLPGRAETFLVIDRFAASVTKKETGKRALVVGSLKHDKYRNLNPVKQRSKLRTEIKINATQKLFEFFGQPLEDIQGYKETVSSFAVSLGKNPHKVALIYRPHPKESPTLITWTLKQFKNNRLSPMLSTIDEPLEKVLAGADYAVSAFSTCGYDLQKILQYSTKPLGVPVYLMMNPKLVNWFQSYTKLSKIPMSSDGMAVTISRPEELNLMIETDDFDSLSTRCWSAVKNCFAEERSAAENIIECLLLDYRSNR